ncbi:uncharacterized protein GGS22DRAFT_120583 [Annulohypoxylon maeteangense]|uniref:uncharacterized protein n=1 Tax=Annulohypoxylon maeteangense TaxID=1927788 RepID=UPI002007C7B8|nr:uncharacterized protein GGS22DRAFT_120583 [Annulohypoxylon maeteangense]KAI0887028.1 hypothetical protein GGS22DRAFT_120583 [Annulohypoxylon maeteangense]
MPEVGVIPPPEGIVPDFHHWTYLQRALISVFAVTLILATTFLALRLYTAFAIVKKLDWDVLFILMSWGGSLGYFISIILGMLSGFGRHLWDVTPTQEKGYFDVLLPIGLTYLWSSTFTKFAMLVLYLRIDPFKLFHTCVYVVGLLIGTYTLVLTILLAGPCNPMFVGSGRCLNNIIISQSVLNIVSEVAVIILPIPVIHKLNMPMRQKVVVGLIMGLGSAVVTISIARVAFVKAMVQNDDVTWTQAESAVFAALELNLGIVCNSMTRLRPFVRAHLPRWKLALAPEDCQNAHIKKPLSWRVDKASHRYQFRSAESREGLIHETRTNDSDTAIYVTNTYEVNYDSYDAELTRGYSIECGSETQRDIRREV